MQFINLNNTRIFIIILLILCLESCAELVEHVLHPHTVFLELYFNTMFPSTPRIPRCILANIFIVFSPSSCVLLQRVLHLLSIYFCTNLAWGQGYRIAKHISKDCTQPLQHNASHSLSWVCTDVAILTSAWYTRFARSGLIVLVYFVVVVNISSSSSNCCRGSLKDVFQFSII